MERLATIGALLLAGVGVTFAQTPSPAGSAAPSPSYSLAPFAERLANARSAKVTTSLLGLKLGDSFEAARAKLKPYLDPAQPAKEEGGRDEQEKDADGDRKPGQEEEEHKVLWQLAKSDYSAVFVKLDEKERLVSITGFLRPGKEVAFDKIGEVKKAPVQDANTIAWDIVRPKQPLTRVVARGAERKASSIAIFVAPTGNDRIQQTNGHSR